MKPNKILDDVQFTAKVQEALDDNRPAIPHAQVMQTMQDAIRLRSTRP